MSTTGSGSPDKSKNIIAIAATIIGVLLLAVIFLGVSNYKTKKVTKELSVQYDESEQLKVELEEQYYAALSDLEGMRGSNEELNALIEQQKGELTLQKEKIDKLIRNERDLTKARKELNNLNQKAEQYLAEINQLRQENEELSANNVQLSERNESLNTELSTAQESTAALSEEKAMLISEKTTLESTNERLASKVNTASVIKVSNIEVTGMKLKKNGNKAKKTYAKNVSELEVCFTTTLNEVADPGMEEFVIRIINPLGETLAIEGMGSGIFVNKTNGEQIRFTLSEAIEYDNDENLMCATWAPNQAFQRGEYEVQVYNKGLLAGSSKFDLK